LNINRTIPRDYQQTNWNPQSSNYKTASKTTMIPAGTYQQQQPSYQLPPQQQQIFLGTYPYPTLSPTVSNKNNSLPYLKSCYFRLFNLLHPLNIGQQEDFQHHLNHIHMQLLVK
jgi:hypothetical protein